MPKKILFIVPSLMMGGMEKVLVSYANLLTNRGYDITIYNLTSDDKTVANSLDVKIHYYNMYNPVKHLLHSKFRDIRSGEYRILPLGLWFRFHTPKYIHKKYVRQYFDTEIAFYGNYSLFIVSGIDTNCQNDVAFFHSNDLSSYYNAHPKQLKQAKQSIEKVKNIVCVSEAVKDDFIATFGRKENVFVINNPVETKKIREMAKEVLCVQKERFTFVNVSRLYDKAKGLHRLLDVCKTLKDEGFKFDLWIIGDGVDEFSLKKHASDSKLDNVIFWGKQENPYKFIANADAYVCASYYEGFSITLIENVILGRLIISTEVSGVKEMIGDSEFGIVTDNSSDGLYSAMKKILTDKQVFEYYCNKAQERKDYFSENKSITALESLL